MQKTTLACFTLAATLLACDPSAAPSNNPPSSSASAATASPASTETQAHGRPLMTQEQADAAMSLADKCFFDTTCDPVEAEKQYRIAADGGAKGLTCTYFYAGIRVMRDHERARACFERQFASDVGCKGAAAGLDRAIFATMLIDAQGGPADPARAKALFKDCYADATFPALEEEAKKRATLDPGRTPLDFCRDVGGSMIAIGECLALEHTRNKAARRAVEHLLGTRLDKDTMALAKKAQGTYKVFVERRGDAASDKLRDSPLRSNAWAGKQNALNKLRSDAMLGFFEYKPSPGGDLGKAERDLDKAFRQASAGDAEHKKVFEESKKAWLEYRDAEIALFVKVFGEKFGKTEVERDVKTTLTARFLADLGEKQAP